MQKTAGFYGNLPLFVIVMFEFSPWRISLRGLGGAFREWDQTSRMAKTGWKIVSKIVWTVSGSSE